MLYQEQLNGSFVQGTAGAPDYTNNWRPYSWSCTLIRLQCLYTIQLAATASALYNGTASWWQGGFLPAVTANNYYTFNITNNGSRQITICRCWKQLTTLKQLLL